jgi:hypothetical protein
MKCTTHPTNTHNKVTSQAVVIRHTRWRHSDRVVIRRLLIRLTRIMEAPSSEALMPVIIRWGSSVPKLHTRRVMSQEPPLLREAGSPKLAYSVLIWIHLTTINRCSSRHLLIRESMLCRPFAISSLETCYDN